MRRALLVLAAALAGPAMAPAPPAQTLDCSKVPCVTLKNAALPGTRMPATGLGTGGYGSGFSGTWSFIACLNWLRQGGRRIDTALGYLDQPNVSRALKAYMKESGLSREHFFITSKIPGGLGEVNSTAAIDTDLEQLGTGYVDLLLAHMPSGSGGKGTPAELRRATWRALSAAFKAGKARAIGVSNYERRHLQDILPADSLCPSCEGETTLKPAVNQIEFHPYVQQSPCASSSGTSRTRRSQILARGQRGIPSARTAGALPTARHPGQLL